MTIEKAKAFPIEKVRDQFPALQRMYNGRRVAYFDGPGGSQVVKGSIEAMVKYMEEGGANLHGSFSSSVDTEKIIMDARETIGDFLDVKPQEIAFGANMTTLAMAISRALGRNWELGDEIVVSELDHRANVDPWITMAEDRGVTIRWIKVNEEKLTLSLDNLELLINDKTKLVAVGLASNAVGTINHVQIIANRAREVGAIVAVDAVHAAPHIPINRDLLGADIIMCSAYKFFGPHIGIAVIKEELFEQLESYKLLPAPNYYPDKLETGTQNHEGIAGIKPAIEFIGSLGIGTTRKERVASGLRNIELYENQLATLMREGLERNLKVTLYQGEIHVPKTPTIAFTVTGYTPQEVCIKVAEEHGVFIADGDFYATTLATKLGLNEQGGWIRAGLSPYNTKEEVRRFISALDQL